MPIVEVDQLSHHYGAHQALNGVSFTVVKGETFALLGPNGGGKTTLFRILSTLFPPSGGTARILGDDVRTNPAGARTHIGVVFQHPSLDGKLTVRENLIHQGRLYGLGGAALRDRVTTMMKELRVEDRANDLVQTLSGGLQRRAELAKGLLHQPELLILDEPSVGLDPGARHDLWEYLDRLRREQQVTILVTTHLIEEADRATRVLILDKGHVVATGTPEALKNEIGGDVIALNGPDNDALGREITSKFGIAAVVLNGTVRIEKADGHRFVTTLIEAFPGEIESVTISKPTLEDVFIAKTGHRLWEDQ
jgi:ABC-2 type transport system ATP-binding protein